MKKTILSSLLILALYSVHAQDYTTAVGIRLGPNSAAITSGFTIKHFLNEKTAVEGIVGINDGFGVCGLYEIHFPIESVKNLQWFVGPGAYLAFRNSTYNFRNGGSTNFGAAGVIGADYKFEDIPLNISLDWKPELNILTNIGFEPSGVGISARFTF